MKRASFMTVCLLAALSWGCSVMPPQIRDQALPSLPFDELIDQVEQYKGQTVIVGGYVVSVENLDQQTRLVAVQSPLGAGDRPRSKDLTEGRLVLVYKGFLDPEVYARDRQITAGGRIVASSALNDKAPYPYLEVEVETLHLWPVEPPVRPDPYWDDDYGYPYPWRWHPFWHPPYW